MFCHRCRREVHLVDHLCRDRTDPAAPATLFDDEDELNITIPQDFLTIQWSEPATEGEPECPTPPTTTA